MMKDCPPLLTDIFTDTPKPAPSFGRQAIFIVLFLLVTPVTLFSAVLSFYTLSKPVKDDTKNVQVYAALPVAMPGVSGSVIGDDARVLILQKYLNQNTSPLAPYADLLVETADYYHLDWKLLPAIAQKESGLCRVIPEGSHNCWGWGIHSKGTLMFDDYHEAITTVAQGLKEKYIDEGFTTPNKIMQKYAHPDSTTWADGVSMYMEQIHSLSL